VDHFGDSPYTMTVTCWVSVVVFICPPVHVRVSAVPSRLRNPTRGRQEGRAQPPIDEATDESGRCASMGFAGARRRRSDALVTATVRCVD
jgi:hypothetical protein